MHIFSLIFSLIGDHLTSWLKLETLKTYLAVTDQVRIIFIIFCLAFFSFVITIGGFIGLHAALYLILPWSAFTKNIVLLVLCAFYFCVSPIVMIYASRKKFMRRVLGFEALAKHWSG